APLLCREVKLAVRLLEGCDRVLEGGLGLLGEIAFRTDVLEDFRRDALEERNKCRLETAHLLDERVVQEAVVRGIDDRDLALERHRRMLVLLQKFGIAAAAVD